MGEGNAEFFGGVKKTIKIGLVILVMWIGWKGYIISKVSECIHSKNLTFFIDSIPHTKSLGEIALNYNPEKNKWGDRYVGEKGEMMTDAIIIPSIIGGRYPSYLVKYGGLLLKVNIISKTIEPGNNETKKYLKIEGEHLSSTPKE